MNKVSGRECRDTVSSSDSDKARSLHQENAADFDYTYFCKQVLKETKRKIDVCFLVPVKMYREAEESCQRDLLLVLGDWMDAFLEKEGSIDHFWIYMAYDEGYKRMKDYAIGASSKEMISNNVRANAQTHMNDVSKLGKAQYIARICKEREDAEYWILRVYEITLSKMYTADKMAAEMTNIIKYLKKCGIRVDMPYITEKQNEEQIFQAAANLFLLVIRLQLGIAQDEAVRWYKSGNVAFFRCRDQMLEEFIHLNSLYFCQSYERYLKMRDIAQKSKNKYAAKEVGDILRLGMELQDSHGNRIFVEPDGEQACEFYRICIDANYIPAYVPAVKTGALIDERQREALLQTALEERDLDSLAYHAEKLLIMADKLLHTEQERALHALRDAADAIVSLEDTYGEKHVLKGLLLMTETFQVYKSLADRKPELDNNLQELYSVNSAEMKEDIILAEAEKAYLRAKEYGFYEAEYRLGMLFLEQDKIKSERYFEQGVKKGCKWCRLEHAKMQRQQDPQKWLSIMRELGRHTQGDNALQMALAECWVDAEDVLAKAAKGEIELQEIEAAEIYVQIDNIVCNIFNSNQKASHCKIEKTVKLCSKLMHCKDEIKKVLKETIS